MLADSLPQNAVFKGYCLLLLTSLLWGTAFVFQKDAIHHTDAFTFNFLRFGIAIPTLLCLFLLPEKLFAPDDALLPTQRKRRHTPLFIGLGAGIFMFLGISLQQIGLAYTTTGKSGFLTAIYIIIVPILGLFIRQHCRLEVWIGAMATLLGVYLLGSHNSGHAESNFNVGDVLTLLSAVAWACQVVWLAVFARYANVLRIAILQMAAVTVLSGITMLVVYRTVPSWETIWLMRYDILYTGVVSAGIAFTLQILGQRHVPATNAALIMSSEAVFAMLGGIIVLNEPVTMMSLLGCACIFVGIILAQLQGKIFFRKRH